MNVKIIRNSHELVGIESSWNSLYQNSAFRTPFQTYEWVYACATWKEEPGKLFVVLVYDEEELIGIAPLCLHTMELHSKSLFWIGSYDSICDYQGFIIKQGSENIFYTGLFQALKQNKKIWDRVVLAEIPEDLFDISSFTKQIKENQIRFRKNDRTLCYRLILPESKEQYMSEISSEFRSMLESNTRKLAKIPTVSIVNSAHTEDWSTALNALFDLHQKRWAAKGEEGVFAEDSTRKMHLEIVRKLREKDQVWLTTIKNEEEILAVNYLLVNDGIAYSYLSACRVEAPWGKFSLGQQVRWEALKAAIHDGMKIFDFMRGDESYKQRFAAQPKNNIEIILFSSPLNEIIYHMIRIGRNGMRRMPTPLKKWIKKVLSIQEY